MASIPTDVLDLFDVLLPTALARSPEKARDLDTILCFKIEGSGEWLIDCSRASIQPTCMKGSSDGARCTVEITSHDFASMLSDPNVGMQLYLQKKLRLSGDPIHAQKIAPLFDLLRASP